MRYRLFTFMVDDYESIEQYEREQEQSDKKFLREQSRSHVHQGKRLRDRIPAGVKTLVGTGQAVKRNLRPSGKFARKEIKRYGRELRTKPRRLSQGVRTQLRYTPESRSMRTGISWHDSVTSSMSESIRNNEWSDSGSLMDKDFFGNRNQDPKKRLERLL